MSSLHLWPIACNEDSTPGIKPGETVWVKASNGGPRPSCERVMPTDAGDLAAIRIVQISTTFPMLEQDKLVGRYAPKRHAARGFERLSQPRCNNASPGKPPLDQAHGRPCKERLFLAFPGWLALAELTETESRENTTKQLRPDID